MDCIQRANWNRNGSRARFTWGGLKPTRVDPISTLRIRVACLKQQQTDPTARSKRHRAIEIDHRSARSSCKSVKISRSFITGFRAGISLPADSGGLIQPLTNGIEQKRIRNQCAPARRRGTKLGHNAIAVRDQHGFACGRQPDVFAELR
jgi:hypothetical protein